MIIEKDAIATRVAEDIPKVAIPIQTVKGMKKV